MIINTSDIKHIYLATGYVDMRKSIDGLALIVSMEFDLDVMDGSLFIFTNRARKFKVHENPKSSARIIDERQLRWLLEGLEIDQKFAHKSVENRLII